jgi:hypothetical protein
VGDLTTLPLGIGHFTYQSHIKPNRELNGVWRGKAVYYRNGILNRDIYVRSKEERQNQLYHH